MTLRVRIAVVEDEALIAFDLCDAVEVRGYVVAGPYSTLEAAYRAHATVPFDGAVVDETLPDGTSDALVRRLVAEGVPTVIHTGSGAIDDVRRRHPDVPVLAKPALADDVLDALEKAFGRDRPRTGIGLPAKAAPPRTTVVRF